MGKTLVMGIWRDLDQEARDYARRTAAIAAASRGAQANEIARVCGRFEFESDQFMTAEDKARLYLKTGHVSARY